MVASQSTLAASTEANSSDNTVQEEREIEDDVSETEIKSNSAVNQIKVNIHTYSCTCIKIQILTINLF